MCFVKKRIFVYIKVVLISKLLSLDVFGSTKGWRSRTVSRLSSLVSGLSDEDIADIPPSALSSSADERLVSELCQRQKLHVLTADQLEILSRALGYPDCPSSVMIKL